jgi:hypothetical protein
MGAQVRFNAGIAGYLRRPTENSYKQTSQQKNVGCAIKPNISSSGKTNQSSNRTSKQKAVNLKHRYNHFFTLHNYRVQ